MRSASASASAIAIASASASDRDHLYALSMIELVSNCFCTNSSRFGLALLSGSRALVSRGGGVVVEVGVVGVDWGPEAADGFGSVVVGVAVAAAMAVAVVVVAV